MQMSTWWYTRVIRSGSLRLYGNYVVNTKSWFWLSQYLNAYRKDLNEGTELAHEGRQVPPLHQGSPELEGDAEHGKDHVRQGQVGNVEVCYSLEKEQEK